MSKFSSENQPNQDVKRGRSFKNKLLDVIRDKALLDVPKGADSEVAETAYLEHLAIRAFDSEDPQSATLLKEVLSKSYPGLKATMPTIEFDLPENSTPIQKANAILDAVSTSVIPPDVGALLIQAAKYTIDIEMGTELKERIEKLEEALK